MFFFFRPLSRVRRGAHASCAGTQDADLSQRPFLLPRVMQDLQSPALTHGKVGLGSASAPDETRDWRQERFISHARCKWPFRVRVDALQLTPRFLKDQVSLATHLPHQIAEVFRFFPFADSSFPLALYSQIYRYTKDSDFKVDEVWVEVALYMNGKIIRDPKGREVRLSSAWWHQGGMSPDATSADLLSAARKSSDKVTYATQLGLSWNNPAYSDMRWDRAPSLTYAISFPFPPCRHEMLPGLKVKKTARDLHGWQSSFIGPKCGSPLQQHCSAHSHLKLA